MSSHSISRVSSLSDDTASVFASDDEDWTVMDPEDVHTCPIYQYEVSDLQPTQPSVPPVWIEHLQPLLPPTVAASAIGLHRSFRAQAVWAVPLARRASAASQVVGAQAMRGASHVATVGPPEAQRLANRAVQMSFELADTVQDQMRWFWFSTQERRVAQAWYDWLEANGYIIDGQLESQPVVEMITEREKVRRVSALKYVTLMQWARYCAALQDYEGPLTPWGLAALLRHA